MPKLSIITINYNNREGLKRTISSVLNQTWKEFEYIVIDGGSTDGSVPIIEMYSGKLSYWVTEKDKGVYYAMNKGILKANGDYLLFLNSGDVLVDENVINALIANEDSNVDLVYGDLKRTFTDGSQEIVKMPDFIDVETIMRFTLCHPVTLIRKRLFDEYGLYDERLRIVADWAFFLKVIILGNATQKHKNVVVSNFGMDGISSHQSNQSEIYREREWVKSNYLSPAFIKLFNDYSVYKNFYQNKWLARARRLYNLIKYKKRSLCAY